jgi:hypothetical protein
MSSAQRQFHKEHPGAEILAQTANDATEHTGYWPHSTTRRYADYTFRYRGADGVEHEEMILPNQITAANAGWRGQFRFRGSRHRPGVAEFYR